MVDAAEHGLAHDLADRFDLPRLRCVPVQRQMRSALVVVRDVLVQDTPSRIGVYPPVVARLLKGGASSKSRWTCTGDGTVLRRTSRAVRRQGVRRIPSRMGALQVCADLEIRRSIDELAEDLLLSVRRFHLLSMMSNNPVPLPATASTKTGSQSLFRIVIFPPMGCPSLVVARPMVRTAWSQTCSSKKLRIPGP